MSEFVIYHNPRCRKSRETLGLLEGAGIQPKVILYLDTPPNIEELKELSKKLGLRPIEFTRTKEDEFKALALDPKDIGDDQMFEILASNPKLIERPIVVKGKKAVIGRPPDNVKTLL